MCCSLQEYNVEILNIRGDCFKKAKWSSKYKNKISLENFTVILLYQKSDEPVSITGVLDCQIIITLSIF